MAGEPYFACGWTDSYKRINLFNEKYVMFRVIYDCKNNFQCRLERK